MDRVTRDLVLAVLLLPFVCGVSPVLGGDQPEFLIGKHAQWKYQASADAAPEGWKEPAFDDRSWKSGPAGFGYGDDDDRTVLKDMQGQYTTVYLRGEFLWQEKTPARRLVLYVNFDDGFVAYLNGTQIVAASVARRENDLKVSLHEAKGHEPFVVENASRLLKPGRNVLAVEGHNANLDSSDFSLDPILATGELKSLVGAEGYRADLDEFRRRLADQSSYLTRRGFDYAPALKELRNSINDETQMGDFVCGLQKIVAQIGDCHAGVSSKAWPSADGFLPLRAADTDSGVAALKLHENEPLDAECPCLESIDGIPLERWLEAAGRFVDQGSPQLIHRRSLGWLGRVSVLREELGLPGEAIVTVGLRSADGSKHCQKRLRLTGQRYSVANVKLEKTRRLDGNLGYLRIPAMDKRLVDTVVSQLREFRDTDGLIIDVRDNGGGTYHILRAIYGFFMPKDAEPYVTNIAAFRLSKRFRENHIEYRPTYRAEWDGWNEAERAAIAQAAKRFRPEWQPPEGKFSDWHYMVLSPNRSRDLLGDGAEDLFYYDKPVVVLCNARSFSATDGFLSAFADLPQVTLVGESSGGGSGSTRRFTLPNTEIRIALSSMASFRANGKLFDGNGVEVDVPVKPTLEDFTERADSVLQRGVQVIHEKRQ